MQYLLLAAILWGGVSVAPAVEPKRATKESLVGTWVKERASNADEFYVESLKWDISVTFQTDGKFVWHAIRREHFTDKNGKDVSVKGTYSVKGGGITYRFDNPSPEAWKELPKFIACFPKKTGGYHGTYFIDDDTLCLSAEKIGTIFERKIEKTETAKTSASEAGNKPVDAFPSADSKPTTTGSLLGAWVMTQAKKEGYVYPAGEYWDIMVSFQSNGRFDWHAIKKFLPSDNHGTDVSATGTYSIDGSLITYQFDKPSPEVSEHLSKFFDFQPEQLRGQHAFLLPGSALLLANEEGRYCFYFIRKAKGAAVSSKTQGQ